MESCNWFVFRDNNVSGPITTDQLDELVRAAVITPDDQICREGEENWSFVRDVMSSNTASISSPVSDKNTASQDRFWRVAGILFCASNLLACLLVGALKAPTATVQYLHNIKSVNEQNQKAVKKATDDAVKAMKHVLEGDK